MKHLLENKWECTDPDNLQFCVKINDGCWWYCQPIELTEELRKFAGYPKKLIAEGSHLILNESLWAFGETCIDDVEDEQIEDLVNAYGYDFTRYSGSEDIQLIIEMYFETYINDFINN